VTECMEVKDQATSVRKSDCLTLNNNWMRLTSSILCTSGLDVLSIFRCNDNLGTSIL
jgi:hypothetical protein